MSEAEGTEADAGAVPEAEGAVDGTEAEAGVAKAVAAAGACAEAGAPSSWKDAGRARSAAEPEPWWEVIDSSTEDGVGGEVELGEALEAVAMSVEVAGLK